MKKLFPVYLIIFVFGFNKTNAQFTFQKSLGITINAGSNGGNQVSVVQSQDGGYFIGGTLAQNNGDIFLCKLNAIGDTLWTKTYGGDLQDAFSSIGKAPGGFIISGETRSFGTQITAAYLIRTDSLGNLIWSKTYGGEDWSYFSSVKHTSDNGFIACGRKDTDGFYIVKTDSSGSIVWSTNIFSLGWASSIQETFDKGFIIVGFDAAAGPTGIFILKIDSTGNALWSKVINESLGEGAAQCVKQCSDSGYIITGKTFSWITGDDDTFLLKIDSAGNFNWMKTYGGTGEEWGFDIKPTADNGFVIVGRTQSFGQGDFNKRNIYLLKTNSAGDTVWTRAYGSSLNFGYSVEQTPDNGYIIVSNPLTLQIIKTDSAGNTGGCNEYSTNTIVSTVVPVVSLRPLSISSGSTSENASTLTNYPLAADFPVTTACQLNTVDVKLLSFMVNAPDCKRIIFKWQTAWESNNNGFEIEHSTDGYNFNKIAFILGTGNSDYLQNYSYQVMDMPDGINYYRLKQIDFSGRFNLSSIISFEKTCNDNSIGVFPNPTKHGFQITGLTNSKNDIVIFAVSGVKVAQWVRTSQRVFNIKDLPDGIYFLRINNDKVYKIIKQ